MKRSRKQQVPQPQRWAGRENPADLRINASRLLDWRDFYHSALTMPGWLLFLVLAIAYFALNLLFALLYRLDPGGITNVRPDSFGDFFFFSVQTMSTIGYGFWAPQSTYTNMLVTIEALLGLTGFALAAALMFARFARPTARVMFSDVAVIMPFEGAPTLMFRVANQRRNRIQEARVRVDLVRDEVTPEGIAMRRVYELPLVRARNPIFALTWMVMHRLREDSPLHALEHRFSGHLELIVTLSGTDETFAQTIYARHSFLAHEILWGYRFVDIIAVGPDGVRQFDYSCFHEVEKLAP